MPLNKETKPNTNIYLAQSAAEYPDCISAEGKDSPNECLGCDSKQSNAKYPFIAIAPRLTLDQSGEHLIGSFLWIK